MVPAATTTSAAEPVELALTDVGRGSAVVLIHGWGCDRSLFTAQCNALSPQRRVIAPDLRGHGDSPAPPGRYDMPTFAADVAALIERLDVEDFYLVGHSMGGAVALEAAARGRRRPAGVVLLDSSAPPASTSWSGIERLRAALATDRYEAEFRDFCRRAFFIDSDDPERREAIIDLMADTPRHVLAGTLEGILAWDAEPAVRACSAPLLYIGSSRPRGDLERLRAWSGDLRVAQAQGSGHFVQVFAAALVNRLIERFVAGVANSGAARHD